MNELLQVKKQNTAKVYVVSVHLSKKFEPNYYQILFCCNTTVSVVRHIQQYCKDNNIVFNEQIKAKIIKDGNFITSTNEREKNSVIFNVNQVDMY